MKEFQGDTLSEVADYQSLSFVRERGFDFDGLPENVATGSHYELIDMHTSWFCTRKQDWLKTLAEKIYRCSKHWNGFRSATIDAIHLSPEQNKGFVFVMVEGGLMKTAPVDEDELYSDAEHCTGDAWKTCKQLPCYQYRHGKENGAELWSHHELNRLELEKISFE